MTFTNKEVEALKAAAIADMKCNNGCAYATIKGVEYRADAYSKLCYNGKQSLQVTFFVVAAGKKGSPRITNAALESATK